MHYVLDLLQGLGIAAGVGIRPFLPTLLVGALAAANLGIDFSGTDFAFLEKPAFLIVIVILVAALGVLERRRGPELGSPTRSGLSEPPEGTVPLWGMPRVTVNGCPL